MITSAFWRERRVFLTGHTGFKGAWLALMLERLNARVTGYGFGPVTTPSLYDLVDAGRELCDVRGDVGDATLLDGVLRAADPDIVLHMATRPPRRADGAAAVANAQQRAEGDLAVVDAVSRAPSVQTALIVSPDRAPAAPAASAQADCGAARIFSIHCPDPLGGGDFASPGALSETPIAPQPALHVLDALYGLLLLAERAEDRAGKLPGHWALAAADDRRAGRKPVRNAALGWSRLLDATETAAWTNAWRRAFAAGADMRAFTFEQIDCYLGQRVRLTSPFALAGESVAPLRRISA